MKRPVKSWSTKKRIIGVAIIFLLFSFFSYMAILSVIRGSKTLDKLNYAQGQVKDIRYIKYKYSTKFNTVYKDVLVLRVEGTTDEFGFMEGNDAYKKLSSSRVIGKTAEIYYDSSGKRIEQGITLHTVDLKIGNYQIINLADVKRRERLGSFFFISGALFIFSMTIAVVRKKKLPQPDDVVHIGDEE